jgi:Fe-S cluster assembly protein SufD
MSLKQRQRCSEYFSFGGNLTRNNLNFYFGEKNSKLLERNYNYGEKQRRPLYVGTACYSNCVIRESDRSTGVFNGKIYVEKEAQKQTHSKKQ